MGSHSTRGTAFHPDVSGRGEQQAVDHFESRGLARAASAEQHERFAGLNGKAELGEDRVAGNLVTNVAKFHQRHAEALYSTRPELLEV
jgi:hypothetical protein